MPIYEWGCKKCGKMVETYNSIKDSDLAPEEDNEESKECTHDWEKRVVPVQRHTYGPNFTGRKGEW